MNRGKKRVQLGARFSAQRPRDRPTSSKDCGAPLLNRRSDRSTAWSRHIAALSRTRSHPLVYFTCLEAQERVPFWVFRPRPVADRPEIAFVQPLLPSSCQEEGEASAKSDSARFAEGKVWSIVG